MESNKILAIKKEYFGLSFFELYQKIFKKLYIFIWYTYVCDKPNNYQLSYFFIMLSNENIDFWKS